MPEPSQARPIRLVCRECGAVRQATRHYIQDALRVRESGRIAVDWDRAEAVHTCRACTQRAAMAARNAAAAKRHGRQAFRERGRRLTDWNAGNPGVRVTRMLASLDTRTWREPSELDTARRRLSNLHLELAGVLGLCVVCHRLTYIDGAAARGFREQGREHVGRFHAACYRDWHKEPVMRAWVSACRRAGMAGRPKPEMPVPPHPATRMSSPDELLAGYVTTVRYFRQREGIGPAERDEHGEVRSVTWLAKKLHLSRRGLYSRVDRFLALLPDESVATGRPAMWRDIFLTLVLETEGGDSNVTHLAHSPEPNVTHLAHPLALPQP
jgi:hypothetical protein